LLEQAADELAKHHRAICQHCDANADWTYAGGTFSSRLLLERLSGGLASLRRHRNFPLLVARFWLPPNFSTGRWTRAGSGKSPPLLTALVRKRLKPSIKNNEGWEHAQIFLATTWFSGLSLCHAQFG
jgi:hypothetical protein